MTEKIKYKRKILSYFIYLILSDPGRGDRDLSCGVWILGVRVVTRMVRTGSVGVTVLASKLDVLHHAVVVLDVILDIDVTKVGCDVGPVPARAGLLTVTMQLMMVTRVMTGGAGGRLSLGLPGLLLGVGQGALQH